MKLLIIEGQHPIETVTDSNTYFPENRLRVILCKLLSPDKNNTHLFNRFKEYTNFKDIQFYIWKLLPGLVKRLTPCLTCIENLLSLISTSITTTTLPDDPESTYAIINNQNWTYDYTVVRKNINKTWSWLMVYNHTEITHRQLLILLLEKILSHLDKPLLLTDFLMESLDVGK